MNDTLRVLLEAGKKERRVRRIGHHVMDHAWEMEDRDLSS